MIKKNKNKGLICASLALILTLSGCKITRDQISAKKTTKPEKTVTITIWNYYNGQQLEAFDDLVTLFNETQGKEKGIKVEGHSLGNVNDLEQNVLDAVNQKVGASEIPNIFAAYADTAYEVDQLGYVADLRPYLSEEEQDRFVESYLKEGEFSGDQSLKIFPIAKSTEIFMLNKTDWNKFAQATGAQIEDLKTIEGMTQVAQEYYEWTDSLTEASDDGRAFFGRDAMANYFLVSAKQLGTELIFVENGEVKLDFDKEVIRKIWDYYYVPFVKGYFAASGKFRSDDIKTGNIIAFTGASSGATFFPNEVTIDDTHSYPIDLEVMEAPQFAGGEAYAVQQGAGMVVTNADEEKIEASVEFLKWFTEDERNIQFSLASGYMPVTKAANDLDKIEESIGLSEKDSTFQIVKTALDTVSHNELYITKALKNGTSVRNILEYSMSDKAKQDRLVVEKRMQSGQSLETASREFTSDACFEEWYQETKNALENLIK